MSNYTIRAIELHDFTQIWDLSIIRKRLDFMVRNNLNALVFHEPGIEDKIVFPAKFLGGSGEIKSYYDAFLQVDHNIYHHALRENLNLNRRDYMNHLIREAKAAGVDVYFENKELWFSDFILKHRKKLMQDGVICPSDPFWWEEFLPYKYKELFAALPDLAGTVTSIGTGEARLAIYCFARYAIENGADAKLFGESVVKQLKEALDEYRAYKRELTACPFMERYPYDALLNPERVDYYINDTQAIVSEAGITV